MGVGLVLQSCHCSADGRHWSSVAREHGFVETGGNWHVHLILLTSICALGVTGAYLEVSNMEFIYDQAWRGRRAIFHILFHDYLGDRELVYL